MTETRFEGDGPVARYWLSRCEGFEVAGEARGVVEELIRDADPFVTTRLVVRTRSRRRTVISAAAVTSIDPEERVLVVKRRGRREEPRAQISRRSVSTVRVRRAAASTLREYGPVAASSTRTAARQTRAATAASVSTVRKFAPVAAASTRRAVRQTHAAGAAAVAAARPHARTAWSAGARGASTAARHAKRVAAPAFGFLRGSFKLLLLELRASPGALRASVRRSTAP